MATPVGNTQVYVPKIPESATTLVSLREYFCPIIQHFNEERQSKHGFTRRMAQARQALAGSDVGKPVPPGGRHSDGRFYHPGIPEPGTGAVPQFQGHAYRHTLGRKMEYGWFKGQVVVPTEMEGARLVVQLRPNGRQESWAVGRQLWVNGR
jgi:hypothetical protein